MLGILVIGLCKPALAAAAASSAIALTRLDKEAGFSNFLGFPRKCNSVAHWCLITYILDTGKTYGKGRAWKSLGCAAAARETESQASFNYHDKQSLAKQCNSESNQTHRRMYFDCLISS